MSTTRDPVSTVLPQPTRLSPPGHLDVPVTQARQPGPAAFAAEVFSPDASCSGTAYSTASSTSLLCPSFIERGLNQDPTLAADTPDLNSIPGTHCRGGEATLCAVL